MDALKYFEVYFHTMEILVVEIDKNQLTEYWADFEALKNKKKYH